MRKDEFTHEANLRIFAMRKRTLFIVCAVFMASWNVDAQITDKVGTAGFQFLRIGVGARETALAEAGTPIAEGPNAIFWNPAGLIGDERVGLQFFYNPWFATIKHSVMSVRIPFTPENVVGVSVNLLSMDDMEETTIDQPQGTGRTFSAGGLAISGAYAQRISDWLSVGIVAKYVREHIWDMVADGWAFDIGLTYHYEGLTLGAVLKDFGTDKVISGQQLELNQQVYPGWDTSPAVVSMVPRGIRLPISFQFGAAYNVIDGETHRVRALGNIAYYIDIGQTENVAAEYTFLQSYSLRVGYKFNRDILGFSIGAGVATTLGSTGIGADFAAVEMKEFGYRTQLGLFMSF